MYTACFEASEETDRNFDINYLLYEKNDNYFIEAYIPGGNEDETACLGKCKEKAENAALHFSKSALRPIHLADVISDMAQ